MMAWDKGAGKENENEPKEEIVDKVREDIRKKNPLDDDIDDRITWLWDGWCSAWASPIPDHGGLGEKGENKYIKHTT